MAILWLLIKAIVVNCTYIYLSKKNLFPYGTKYF